MLVKSRSNLWVGGGNINLRTTGAFCLHIFKNQQNVCEWLISGTNFSTLVDGGFVVIAATNLLVFSSLLYLFLFVFPDLAIHV
jgi:hypothetical protein